MFYQKPKTPLFELNTKYQSDYGVITILRCDDYDSEQGSTRIYMFLEPCGTKVDEFTEFSTFAKNLRKIK